MQKIALKYEKLFIKKATEEVKKKSHENLNNKKVSHTPECNAKKFQISPQFIILRFFMADLQMPRLLNDSVHKKGEKRV